MTAAVNTDVHIDNQPLRVRVMDLLEKQGTVMTITEIVNVIQHSSNPLKVDKPNTSIGKTLSDAMRCDKSGFEPRLSSPGRSHYVLLDAPETDHSCYGCNGGIKKTSTDENVMRVLDDFAIDSVYNDGDKPEFHCQAYGLRWQKSLIVWGNQHQGYWAMLPETEYLCPLTVRPRQEYMSCIMAPTLHTWDARLTRWVNVCVLTAKITSLPDGTISPGLGSNLCFPTENGATSLKMPMWVTL